MSISLKNISAVISGEKIIEHLSLDIPSGKFFALLGPSGCGKTTLLRLIAGLQGVQEGTITLAGQDITHMPINERRVNTVFQQYALFPHLSVFENVAYPLRLRGVSPAIVEEKVMKMLRILDIEKHVSKRIANLSGGQQQRVALARAIVNEPDVLLLDEPLAALDLKLREQVLIELMDLQEKLATTFVYVTHDQDEALTVADQMAIMNQDGIIEQTGTPKEIYEFPTTSFVANFVGKTNLFRGTMHPEGQRTKFEVHNVGTFSVFTPEKKSWIREGAEGVVSLRPEKIAISKRPVDGADNQLTGTVQNMIYYGSETKYLIALAGGVVLSVLNQNRLHLPPETIDYDDTVYLSFPKENILLLER